MSQPAGIILVLIGVCFLYLGLQEANLTSGTTMPREANIWFLVTGAVATVLGLYFMVSQVR